MDYDFTVEHRAGPELAVPDALSRDAVPKPLCHRCHKELYVERISGSESVRAIVEVNGWTDRPTMNEFIAEQELELGDLTEAARRDKKLWIDNDGLLRAHVDGGWPIYVPKAYRDR